MDRKSRFLIWFFIAVFIAAVMWKFESIVVRRNFIINAHIACDPSKDICFKAACDSSSGEDCTNDTYAKIEKRASNVAVCDKFKQTDCLELSCAQSEADCTVIFCSSDAAEEGESCVGPEEAATIDHAATSSNVLGS